MSGIHTATGTSVGGSPFSVGFWDSDRAELARPGKRCMMVTNHTGNSSTAEAEISCGSRRVWAYYPHGLLPSHEHFRLGTVPETRLPFCHECRPGLVNPKPQRQKDAAANPERLLFQEAFHVCKVKDFGDLPSVRDIYVETVVDAACGLGFAKVYPFKNARNAADILQDRVLPFYQRYAVTVARICTRNSREYCGLPSLHPFETLLVTSHIGHSSLNPSCGMYIQPCEDFYHVLCMEFFTPAIRSNSYKSFGKLQQDLDVFVEKYNHERPYFAPSSQELTPFALFLDAIDLPGSGAQPSELSREGV
jgi:hypothetical protein